ncbi:MAG: DUF3500 domain-containing protein [Chloroflexi bacterium]|nr:DUF3500 domain-containing protein [Chloroflexota bacterium]MYC06401.1 DUF3500 domain-containing protein [Chloroflexota bacterium]
MVVEMGRTRVTEIAARGAELRFTAGDDETSATVAAANAFLSLLDDGQRSSAMYAIDDPVRPNWSNLPAGILDFERNGARIGDMNDEQVSAIFAFLATALSAKGYKKVVDVVGADEVLSHTERAPHFAWTDENYWLAFFGTPSDSEKWGWQFGGHHLGVNVTLVDGISYMSPTFIGIEPAEYEAYDETIAPLAPELEAGLALINALNEQQRNRSMVGDRPLEVWTAAGHDGFIPALEGSCVADWSTAQRQTLADTVAMWFDILDDESRKLRVAELDEQIKDARFAWHGEIDGSGPIYYRIQAPALIIEYSTQGGVGADTGHYHSIYRDPTNEYGVSVGN